MSISTDWPGRRARRSVVVCGVAALLLTTLAACSDTSAPSEPAAKASEPAWRPGQIRPETLVRFPKGMMACLTRDALQDALTLALAGEQTKMNEHFASQGGAVGDCLMLDPKRTYKVIVSEYNVAEAPEMGLLEIVGEDVTAANSGAWAMVIDKSMVRIVREPTER